jgi:hypothetical protein
MNIPHSTKTMMPEVLIEAGNNYHTVGQEKESSADNFKL